MKNQNDFLASMDEEIAEKGIVVLKNVRGMPVYGKPYIYPHYIISINHRGSVCVEYDGKMEIFTPHSMAIVYPNHTLFVHSSSEDYNTTLIIVSEKLYRKMSILNTHSSRFRHEQQPHFILTPKQYEDIKTLVEALEIIMRSAPTLGDLLMCGQLHVFVEIINNYRAENEGKSIMSSGHKSSQLYDAIAKHYKEHRNVEFYASLFCLSPKYFTTVIKQETGHNVSYWIERHIIMVAKTMLCADAQLPIQNISDEIGFPDVATFSRYFKRATGSTPSQYRQQYQ